MCICAYTHGIAQCMQYVDGYLDLVFNTERHLDNLNALKQIDSSHNIRESKLLFHI